MDDTAQSLGAVRVEMPINKFGISLEGSASRMNNPHYQWSALVRNYVRDNALCLIASDFDAKSRKICRVATPEADSDAANKRYVEQCIKNLKDLQDDFEKRLAMFERHIYALRVNINEVRTMLQPTHAD